MFLEIKITIKEQNLSIITKQILYKLFLCIKAVFITDGKSTQPHLTKKQADLVHQENILVFGIGVSNTTDKTELNIISSDPDEKYSFQVEDRGGPNRIRKEVASGTCSKFFKKLYLLCCHEISKNKINNNIS